MKIQLLLALIGDMSFIAVTAYVVGRNRRIIGYANNPHSIEAWFTLTIIFSVLSIIGSYQGHFIAGALASTRIIGTLMGGIIGGPAVGFSVGLIGGIHRYFIGGFTAPSCAVATFIAGLMAGWVRHKVGFTNLNWKIAAGIALVAELIQKSLTLLFAKPFEVALATEKVIAFPTTLVSVIGVVLFVLILKDLQAQIELSGAKTAQISLEIANQTLTHLRQGLTSKSAQKTAKIIYDLSGADAVAITDKERVLAFIGVGCEHHTQGQPFISEATHHVIKTATTIVFSNADKYGCNNPECPLQSGVIAPLIVNGLVVGSINIFKVDNNSITAIDTHIATGLGRLLSEQIELAEIDNQRKLREKAEFKALQAQINPHFLFNTLNIIMSFCRTSPETARELLANLSLMLHYSFSKHNDFVTIAEELETIRAYLEIAKARFGPRLAINITADSLAMQTHIPILSLQPIVENAVIHGLFPKISDCELNIDIIRQTDCVEINVIDNGIGINADNLHNILNSQSSGIGIANVNQRLIGLYGSAYQLKFNSIPGTGTTVSIIIPIERSSNNYAI